MTNGLTMNVINPQVLGGLVKGDEASPSMTGVLNSQNVRHYAPKGNAPVFNFNRINSREMPTAIGEQYADNGVMLCPYLY